MAFLDTCGESEEQHFQHPLPVGELVRLGRSRKNAIAVSWDRHISREHADLLWQNGELTVLCLQHAANPVVFGGRPVRKASLVPGQKFRIGKTDFTLLEDVDSNGGGKPHDTRRPTIADSGRRSGDASQAPPDYRETPEYEGYRYSPQKLAQLTFRNADRQMELLAKLPRVIFETANDAELADKILGLLLDAVPQASAAAVVAYDEADIDRLAEWTADAGAPPQPQLMQVALQDDYSGRFRPSRRLLAESLKEGESVIHIWSEHESGEDAAFTLSGNLDWAFCAPLSDPNSRGWCLYVGGGGDPDAGFVTEEHLKGDLRFTQLLGQFIGSVRKVRSLEEQKTRLSSFFSPKVVDTLILKEDAASRESAEQQITVLFCDVRGFSRKSEQLQDNLMALLNSVRAALGVITSCVLENDGAISDFQGDAALAFWGWPVEIDDGPLPACSTALDILAEFERKADHNGLLDGFSVGMGLSHGRAIAGQIGTDYMAKIGVFGPVVNQGARLEGMTRQFKVPICLDENTASFMRQHPGSVAGRVRRLARVRPKGMDHPLTVSELLLPGREPNGLTDAMIDDFDAAVKAVIIGHWDEALQLLKQFPATDGPAQFLIEQMARTNSVPPDDWTGYFDLTTK